MDTVGGQARLWTQKCTGIPMHGWEGRAKRGCRKGNGKGICAGKEERSAQLPVQLRKLQLRAEGRAQGAPLQIQYAELGAAWRHKIHPETSQDEMR